MVTHVCLLIRMLGRGFTQIIYKYCSQRLCTPISRLKDTDALNTVLLVYCASKSYERTSCFDAQWKTTVAVHCMCDSLGVM